MVQLHVLTGAEAGKTVVARTFPFKVGRNSGNSLILSDPGVFAEHFEVRFSDDGFSLAPYANAVVTLNAASTEGAILRNGDVIGCGLAKVQFWLAQLPQGGLRARELVSWALIALVAAAQIYILIWLLGIGRS
jgi:hypothetical protein